VIPSPFDLFSVTFCRRVVEDDAYLRRRHDGLSELFEDELELLIKNFVPLASDVGNVVKCLSEVVADLRRLPLRSTKSPRNKIDCFDGR